MKRFILLIVFVVLQGCATTDRSEMTEQELKVYDDEQFRQEYNRGIDFENWRMCQKMYDQAGKSTLHMDHQHNRRHRGRYRHWEVKSDLMYNECRRYLKKEYWADHMTKDKVEKK